MTPRIADICRYPVKGLSAESLQRVHLSPGQGLPHDRRFAIAHGATSFDPKAPQWLAKTNFLMLMRDEKLAQLGVAFAPETGLLTISRGGKPVIQGKATDPMGRTLIDLKYDPGRSISRQQMELIAARVSALQDCFY